MKIKIKKPKKSDEDLLNKLKFRNCSCCHQSMHITFTKNKEGILALHDCKKCDNRATEFIFNTLK